MVNCNYSKHALELHNLYPDALLTVTMHFISRHSISTGSESSNLSAIISFNHDHLELTHSPIIRGQNRLFEALVEIIIMREIVFLSSSFNGSFRRVRMSDDGISQPGRHGPSRRPVQKNK